MNMRESFGAIKEADRILEEVFKGLRMAPGSVCMIASQYLKNWGILVTEDNREFIRSTSLEGYRRQWKSASGLTHEMINFASSRAGISYNNRELNQMLASMALRTIEEMVNSKEKRKIRILDIGAGDGKTTISLLNQMKITGKEALAERCKFILLDPSPNALCEAYMSIGDRGSVLPIGGTLEDYFEEDPKPVDIVISNAVFHHFSFPDFLGNIRQKLAENGVMVVGDWHTTIWSQPAFLVPILRMLGAEESRIRMFEVAFNVKQGDLERLERELTDMQKESNIRMREYERYLAEELGNAKQTTQLLLFEAHESLADRIGKYREQGFVTDFDELKKKRWCKTIRSNVRTPKSKYELGAVVMVGR